MRIYVYAALGDSTGVGVGAEDKHGGYVTRAFDRLWRENPGARLSNFCENGATSGDVLARQIDRAVKAEPDLVTLFVGGNDLWRGVEPVRFGQNLDAIADRLAAAKSRAPVLLGTLANMAHAPAAALAEQFARIPRSSIEERVRAYNVEVARVAARHGFTVVDLFRVGLADAPHYFSFDGFHPSAAGYTAWAELLWESMAATLAPVSAAR